jgi:hypothetical protein
MCKVGSTIIAILCFLGIVAYWYFLPYQFYLGLISAGSSWGLIITDLVLLVTTIIIGIPITIVLFIVMLAELED